MSRVSLRLVAALVAVGAGVWIFAAWYGSDARRIGRNLERLQTLVGKLPAESDLTGLGKSRKIAELFADRFEFRARQFDFATRDRGRLVSAIHQYRSRSDTIAMRIFDRDLQIDPDARRATTLFTAEFITGVRGTMGREGYRFQVDWVELDGRWQADFVDLLEVIEEPALPF